MKVKLKILQINVQKRSNKVKEREIQLKMVLSIQDRGKNPKKLM